MDQFIESVQDKVHNKKWWTARWLEDLSKKTEVDVDTGLKSLQHPSSMSSTIHPTAKKHLHQDSCTILIYSTPSKPNRGYVYPIVS
ncbi:hypothetical protein Y032_0168g186 [Ancylostoma ceylanicum]|uniref:Uncharacterized protein n=1 Tax=Ancylostoma ceylanicum TaxID=53326 RepID=A0A016SWC1_9BILA|nr:hypothetical protein Y032_0168g186 [Ancylostoma ceylanicum]